MSKSRVALSALCLGALAIGLTSTGAAAVEAPTPPAQHETVAPSDGTFQWIGSPTYTPNARSINALGVVSPMFNRTWTFAGTFKAALTSQSFANTAVGGIKVDMTPGQCTPGYPKVYLTLSHQNTIGWGNVSPVRVSYPCDKTSTFTWPSQPVGTYRLIFERSGPAGLDENTKAVNGTVYYW